MEAIGLAVVAYLLGSISGAICLCRWLKTSDPLTHGSGNPGATNVLRIAGPKVAFTVLIFDAAKGFLPVVIGHIMGVGGLLLGLVGLAAFIGHCFPIWHRFKGGKGVATFLGVTLAWHPIVGVLIMAVWVLVAMITRFASLASLLAAFATPILLAKFSDFGYVLPCCGMVALLVIRHWGNIMRLREGNEPKMALHADTKKCGHKKSTCGHSHDHDHHHHTPKDHHGH